MTFIRPEVRQKVWRWREVVISGLLILWGVRSIGVGLERESVTQTFLGGMIAALFRADVLVHTARENVQTTKSCWRGRSN